MSASKSSDATVTTKKSRAVNQLPLTIALIPTLILYAGTLILIAFTRNDLSSTLPYWETLVPVVAIVSLLSGFGHAYLREQAYVLYVLKQAIHWAIVIGLLWLVHTHGVRAALSDQSYLTLLMYLLGLAALLAGLHMDWKFLLFGAFISFCAYLLAAPENVAILGLIGEQFGIAEAQNMPMTMTVGLGVIAFLASAIIQIGTRGAVLSKRIAGARA